MVEGKEVSPDEWLEDKLTQRNAYHKNVIVETFEQRHCVPLVKPLLDNEKLRNFGTRVDLTFLREQFVQGFQDLCDLIKSKAPVVCNP